MLPQLENFSASDLSDFHGPARNGRPQRPVPERIHKYCSRMFEARRAAKILAGGANHRFTRRENTVPKGRWKGETLRGKWIPPTLRRPLRKSVFPVVLSIFADPEGQKILAGGDNHRLIAKRKPAPEGRKKRGNLRGNCPLPPLRGGMLVGLVTGGWHHRLISVGPSGLQRQRSNDAIF
jgi:hypothetical protein